MGKRGILCALRRFAGAVLRSDCVDGAGVRRATLDRHAALRRERSTSRLALLRRPTPVLSTTGERLPTTPSKYRAMRCRPPSYSVSSRDLCVSHRAAVETPAVCVDRRRLSSVTAASAISRREEGVVSRLRRSGRARRLAHYASFARVCQWRGPPQQAPA